MKLCVVGNSHVGMLVAAHQQRGDPAAEMTIFARPSMEDGDIALEGTTLIAKSPEFVHRLAEHGQAPEIDLADFEAIVFVGMTASVFTAAQILGYHTVYGWPSTQRMLEDPGPAERQIISMAALRASLETLVTESQTARLCQSVSRRGIGPLFVVPQPYPAARVLDIKGKFPIIKRLFRDKEGPLLAAELEQFHTAFFEPIKGVFYLRQDPDTIGKGFLTRPSYSRNSVRLNVERKHRKDDVLHANADFGERILDRIEDHLS
jgi:hypothetical protein